MPWGKKHMHKLLFADSRKGEWPLLLHENVDLVLDDLTLHSFNKEVHDQSKPRFHIHMDKYVITTRRQESDKEQMHTNKKLTIFVFLRLQVGFTHLSEGKVSAKASPCALQKSECYFFFRIDI